MFSFCGVYGILRQRNTLQKYLGDNISSTNEQLHLRWRGKGGRSEPHRVLSLGSNVDAGATNQGRNQVGVGEVTR